MRVIDRVQVRVFETHVTPGAAAAAKQKGRAPPPPSPQALGIDDRSVERAEVVVARSTTTAHVRTLTAPPPSPLCSSRTNELVVEARGNRPPGRRRGQATGHKEEASTRGSSRNRASKAPTSAPCTTRPRARTPGDLGATPSHTCNFQADCNPTCLASKAAKSVDPSATSALVEHPEPLLIDWRLAALEIGP